MFPFLVNLVHDVELIAWNGDSTFLQEMGAIDTFSSDLGLLLFMLYFSTIVDNLTGYRISLLFDDLVSLWELIYC